MGNTPPAAGAAAENPEPAVTPPLSSNPKPNITEFVTEVVIAPLSGTPVDPDAVLCWSAGSVVVVLAHSMI
jgi:hypothetical protein